MKCQFFLFFGVLFGLAFAPGLTPVHAAGETALDTASIEAITGLKGVSNQAEGTFKVSKLCSFDAFPKKYQLDEPELRYLALIVRGADTGRHDLTPESGGLFAISLGLSDLHPGDDQAVLRDGFIVYDALYQWLKFCGGEKHLWFPPASKASTAT